MELTFLGAAGTVTGSRYLIRAGKRRYLVDCGLFQGLKELRLRNWAPFPVRPPDIEAVVLTHAHIDHTGYLPVLVRDGFEGPIYCSPGTVALCEILLPDAGYLQEADAERANRYGYTKHRPALPLFTQADAERAVRRLVAVPYHEELELGDGVTYNLRRAGHIVGSATVSLAHAGTTVVFSGDVGRPMDAVLKPPEPVRHADYLVIESTYGDRQHSDADPADELGEVIRRTAERGGGVGIPAFAVGRTQSLLYHLARLRAQKAIPPIPVYVDSPMAVDATRILLAHRDELRLTEAQCVALAGVATLARSAEESKAIDRRDGPMIVISASGMATGGRVLFHLARFAPDPRNTILFAGYQAAGTRGAAMLAGAESIKIHGTQVPVRAEVVALDGLSAHADADELIAWMRNLERPPRRTFVTHGEPAAADALRRRIEEELGWKAYVPKHGERVVLG